MINHLELKYNGWDEYGENSSLNNDREWGITGEIKSMGVDGNSHGDSLFYWTRIVISEIFFLAFHSFNSQNSILILYSIGRKVYQEGFAIVIILSITSYQTRSGTTYIVLCQCLFVGLMKYPHPLTHVIE